MRTLVIGLLLSLIMGSVYAAVFKADSGVTTETAMVQNCGSGQNADISCYQRSLEQLASTSGLSAAISTLEILQRGEDRLRDCHTLAHKIAGYTVRQHPEQWESLLQTTSPQACSSGFFHGILEGHLATDPHFSINQDAIQNICQQRQSEYEQGSCAHGLGHLALVERLDNLEETLTVCNLPTSHLIQQCFSGVYMEHMVRTNLVDHQLAQTPQFDEQYGKDFSVLCQKNNQPLGQIACWGEMGYLYAGLAGDDTKQLLGRCRIAAQQAHIENCFLTGIQKVAVTSDEDIAVSHACDPVKEKDQLYLTCLGRIIDTTLTTSGSFLARALTLCSVQTDFSESCYITLIHTLKNNRDSFETSTCDQLPPTYQTQCRNSLVTS